MNEIYYKKRTHEEDSGCFPPTSPRAENIFSKWLSDVNIIQLFMIFMMNNGILNILR